MFALFLITLLAAIGLATATVLADSGLRWWSAFARLRSELKGAPAPLPALRPATTAGSQAAFDRSGTIRFAGGRVSYAA
jgi:hypothetical protein